ncbi:MAG TPA: T9SS type A sorting domain-containing protein, partial [Candidatus Sabulitectum sp.]|nr:T9SS type A sorting domain-containing protein [Candidatus Sabulitectum sp.]
TVTGVSDGNHWFRVWAVDDDFGPGWPSEPVLAQVSGSATGDFAHGVTPAVSSLGLVTPNPVSVSAVIPVSVSSSDIQGVSLRIFDLSGRTVADLSSSIGGEGFSNVIWDVSDVPSGVHFVRLEAPSGVTTRRVVVSSR